MAQRFPLLKDIKVTIDEAEDPLGQRAALETLLDTLEAVPAPACVAVYGSWGAGKTTLIHSAMKRWRRDHGPAVWFDPWEYERQDDLLTPFLYTVVRELELDLGNPKVKNLVVGILKTLVSLLGRVWLASATAGASEVVRGALAPLVSAKAEEFGQHFDTWQAYQDEVRETKARFAELMALGLEKHGPGTRVAIFLDDLDRCLPERVVHLIEGIKLLLASDDKNPAVFVFALDRQIVGEAIRQRYPDSTLYTGENYLEKIFDLSLEVPPVPQEGLRKVVLSYFGDGDWITQVAAAFDSSGTSQGFALVAEVLGQPVFANPRVIKRVLNRLNLLLADDAWRSKVALVRDADCYRRFLAWVAGAERYRTFRHYYLETSDTELIALARGLQNQEGALPASVRRVLETPGFFAYANLLFGSANDGTLHERIIQHRVRSGSGLTRIRDFDDLLRSAGL